MLHSTFARRLMAAAVLVPALALAACAPSASPTPSATPSASESATPTSTPTPSATVPAVNTVDGIKVAGAAGAAPTVTVPAPMAIDETRSKVLVAGTGYQVPVGGIVDVQYVGYNGRTGAKFDSSWDRGASAVFPLDKVVAGFRKGLEGKRVGDRVLLAMPGKDAYDEGGGNPDAGIEVGDTLIFVVDVVATSVASASGTAVAPAAGLPAVTWADGKPSVAIPAGAAVPTTTTIQPLVKGSGRAVGEKDYIQVHYRSWSWKTGKQLEDRWATPDVGNIAETIPAWRSWVVGQPIGSRILIVASPTDSYPEGSNNPPLEKGDTLVYVVDILFGAATPWR